MADGQTNREQAREKDHRPPERAEFAHVDVECGGKQQQHSGIRAHPEFKRLLTQAGVADYWRQTGRWGDGCKPIGADDFQCE